LRVDDNCVLCGACIEECPRDALSIKGEAEARVEDTDEWRGVWVFAERAEDSGGRPGVHPVVLELVAKGRKLADIRNTELSAVVMGESVEGAIRALKDYPLDRIYSVESPSLARFRSDCWAAAFSALIEEKKPEIVLCGATSLGRSLLPTVAAHVNTGLTADCTGLEIDPEEGLLEQTRPAFGGNIMARIVCPGRRPQMATVRPNVMQPAETIGGERECETVIFTPPDEALASRIEVLEERRDVGEGGDIAEADIIIAGGRGVGSAEGFRIIKDVAGEIGAAVGASRATVDAGWVECHHQVGQTGSTVQPRLYIACGISGAIQHLVGMQSADKVIAINSDPGAPIFKAADVGLVGDLHAILPRIREKLKIL
jgi:electron transfer flavoprotein alpha subunit